MSGPLPNFLVVGAAKAGTTALCDDLAGHPEICLSRPKETFFFNRDKVWARGVDGYRACFAHHRGERAVGEGTTEYTLRGVFPAVARRVQEVLGDPRIVYVIREPLSRIESMWIELRSQGIERRPFPEAVTRDRWYVDGSRYRYQLDAFRGFVPPDRMLVLTHDDYKADPRGVLQRVCGFLDVNDGFGFPKAGRIRYGSEGKREDTSLSSALRRHVPGFEALRDHSPEWLRTVAARTLKSPIAARPAWTEDLRTATWDAVADDVAAALELAGRRELLPAWRERALSRPLDPPPGDGSEPPEEGAP